MVGIKLAILMMISALVITDSFALYCLECFYLFSPAWNLKFNMAHDYGYSISELNEDDRRKVEEGGFLHSKNPQETKARQV